MTKIMVNADRISSTSVGNHDSDVVAALVGVGKQYRLFDDPRDRLKQMLLKHFGRSYGRTFWAVQNINFELHRGEMLAIIGKNGSGKSTILQMIAGTLAPTEGTISCSGRVGALLELGSGFNPEYTGRENIQLNASILGISSEELKEKIQSIIDFADIGDFIDQPVKLYSSGMFVRLAFAVTTGLDADVLLIDEALAVGDVFFRQKCYQRLREMQAAGVSIIFVTHNMQDVEQFCDQAILLHRGQVMFQGNSSRAVKRYYLIEQEERLAGFKGGAFPVSFPAELVQEAPDDESSLSESDFWPKASAFLPLTDEMQVSDGRARCTGIALCDSAGGSVSVFQQGEQAHFFYEFEARDDLLVPIGGIVLQDQHGIIVHGKNSLQFDIKMPRRVPKGLRLRFHQVIDLWVAHGEYTFGIGFAEVSDEDFRNRGYIPHPVFDSKTRRICHIPGAGRFAVNLPRERQPYTLSHHGLCNLPGRLSLSVLQKDERL